MKPLPEISHPLPTWLIFLHVERVMIVKSDSNWFHEADWDRGGELVLPTHVTGLIK